ncbi:hypothetical protein E5D57_003681 [Metarhizium anisopliae]|nr:hypothetical protein E5D57_003681 [Metarhizium anisopliae]
MELNGFLLRGCIRYLLFEEYEKTSLTSVFRNSSDDTELFIVGSVFDDDDQGLTASALTGSKPSQDCNPSEIGFGDLFGRAASYWTCHFSNVLSERRPDPLDLVALYGKDLRQLENWVEQQRRRTVPIFLNTTSPTLCQILILWSLPPCLARQHDWPTCSGLTSTALTLPKTRHGLPYLILSRETTSRPSKTSSGTRPSGQACAALHVSTRWYADALGRSKHKATR